MCASPIKFFRDGPPPPRVALLPDALFFARPVPVAIDPALAAAAQGAAVAEQIELALEAMAPFPLAQLYHGFYWVPGSDRALIFGAYRRRFTPEQTSAWAEAELVLPTFAVVLGAEVPPATTVVLSAPDGLTAVHWDGGRVPAAVAYRPVAPDATEEDRARARDELVCTFESRKIVELAVPPVPAPRRSDREFVFAAGDFLSRLPASAALSLDVRDKDELAALRRAQGRDVIFWRVLAGCVLASCLLAAGELALSGGRLWQKARRLQLDGRAPIVQAIMSRQEIANHIEDLSNRRLLPIEMIRLAASKKPPATLFLRAVTSGLHTLTVEAETPNAGEIGAYKNDLESLPTCAKVEVKNQQLRNNVASFSLVITFKPDALKSGPSS